jgi:hypothetical protein
MLTKHDEMKAAAGYLRCDRRTARVDASWSLAAERAEDVTSAVASGRLAPATMGWSATLIDGVAVTFSRLYVGDEFCQQLIPSGRELESMIELADSRHVPVTLATPPVTDDGLDGLGPALRALADRPAAEVLVNDWGTLRHVHRLFPELRKVLGRVLHREAKDPRASGRHATASLTEPYVTLLRRFGVSMLSLDRLPADESPLPLAVHLPYEFVTAGRACVISGVAFPEPKKFRSDFACPRPCRTLFLDLRSSDPRVEMRQKGNALYAGNGGTSLISSAAGRVARWVYDLSVDKAYSLFASSETSHEVESPRAV